MYLLFVKHIRGKQCVPKSTFKESQNWSFLYILWSFQIAKPFKYIRTKNTIFVSVYLLLYK